MHPDIFRYLHSARSTELQQQTAAYRRAATARHKSTPRPGIRTQLGWTLVELGLRLVRTTTAGEPRVRRAGTA